MIDKQKIFDFSNKCVSRLGDIVGEMRKEGEAQGFTKQEIQKVWQTIFSIFKDIKARPTMKTAKKFIGDIDKIEKAPSPENAI